MKKTLLALSLMAAAGMMLTACASTTEPMATTSPSTSPSAAVTTSPSAMPQSTMGTGTAEPMGLLPDESTSPAAAQGVTSIEEARKAAEAIEDELEKLSEVDDAQVVLSGTTAAVALEFDEQYQGGIDERMRKIVQERVDGVVRGVTVVEITDDASLMDELEKLGDRMKSTLDLDMDKLRTELEAIIQRITGGRSA